MIKGYRILASEKNVTENDIEFIEKHWKVINEFDNLYEAKDYLRQCFKNRTNMDFVIQTFSMKGGV